MIEKDFYDNFIKLHACKIELNEDIEDNDICLLSISHDTCYVLNLKHYNINERFRYNVNIKCIYEATFLRFTKYSCDSIIYPFLTFNHPYKTINLFNDTHILYLFNGNHYLRANFITRIEKIYTQSTPEYYIVHYGNKLLLQRLLNQIRDSRTTTFMNILYHSLKLDITTNCETALNSILNNFTQQQLIVPKINLVINELNDKYQKLLNDDIFIILT